MAIRDRVFATSPAAPHRPDANAPAPFTIPAQYRTHGTAVVIDI